MSRPAVAGDGRERRDHRRPEPVAVLLAQKPGQPCDREAKLLGEIADPALRSVVLSHLATLPGISSKLELIALIVNEAVLDIHRRSLHHPNDVRRNKTR